jgi:hypothetical protein
MANRQNAACDLSEAICKARPLPQLPETQSCRPRQTGWVKAAQRPGLGFDTAGWRGPQSRRNPYTQPELSAEAGNRTPPDRGE